MPALPPLPLLDLVKERLERIFPLEFPDRGILVGDMAARTVFVALYGGFLASHGKYFRPSTVVRFSLDQAAATTTDERAAWAASCHGRNPATLGTPWYAENTREGVRDDYLRNRAIPMGIMHKREGQAVTSSAPIYSIDDDFAALFDPALSGVGLEQAITDWQRTHLDPMVLRRLRLATSGVFARAGDVDVTLPSTRQTMRLSAGEAAVITKDVCEIMATHVAERPVVVHLSMSDVKMRPELTRNAQAIGLTIDPKAELPDVVIADVPDSGGLRLIFVEVVHSDGPINELRKTALLDIANRAGIAPAHVQLITAFERRDASIFRKRVSELAVGTDAWFRTEPDVLLRIGKLPHRAMT